jgi:hypothetical protein
MKGHFEVNETNIEDRLDSIERKVDVIEGLLHGDEAGNLGFSQKIAVLWRVLFLWPIATASALAGCLITLLVQWLTKHL